MAERLAEIKRWSDNRVVATAASTVDAPHLFEICCSSTSRLSDSKFAGATTTHRITKEHCDFTSAAGLQTVLNQLGQIPHGRAVVWFSIPCTAGCPFWTVNKHHLRAQELHHHQYGDFLLMIHNVLEVAAFATQNGHKIAFEWPKNWRLWAEPQVQQLINDYQLHSTTLDGLSLIHI